MLFQVIFIYDYLMSRLITEVITYESPDTSHTKPNLADMRVTHVMFAGNELKTLVIASTPMQFFRMRKNLLYKLHSINLSFNMKIIY